jgi:malonyl-ACP decarboxylase
MSVVVTGVGVVCSIAGDAPSFAAALRRGSCGITADPWGPDGPPFGARLVGFSLADALASRRALPPPLLAAAERAVRRAPFSLQVAAAASLEAWEQARLAEVPAAAERLAVVVAGNNLTGGYADSQRPTFLNNPAHLAGRFALHVQDTDHVGTLSELLGIRGEGFTIGGASASGNLAIIQASRLLELDEIDACLVVGALAELSAMELRAFQNLGAMAGRIPDEPAPGPAFDRSHRGFVVGQACACLVLESARSAARRAARPLAELCGYAARLDSHRLTTPSEEGERAVMLGAMDRAGLHPHQVTYVNAHGSGSSLGDTTELAALRGALGASFSEPWVNATKALTGHCLGAAGALEAVATVLQIQGDFIHPNPVLDRPIDPECRFAGKRAIATSIRFALSNSFGFGGINSCIALAHPQAGTRVAARPPTLPRASSPRLRNS